MGEYWIRIQIWIIHCNVRGCICHLKSLLKIAWSRPYFTGGGWETRVPDFAFYIIFIPPLVKYDQEMIMPSSKTVLGRKQTKYDEDVDVDQYIEKILIYIAWQCHSASASASSVSASANSSLSMIISLVCTMLVTGLPWLVWSGFEY